MTQQEQISLAGRPDFAAIAAWIRPNARVLDLGCGDGLLLKYLKHTRGVSGYGVEINDDKVIASLRNGINVIQGDLERGLAEFEDGAFDYVILSQTLQAMRQTEVVLDEMLRVGREAIVTFPNFGYWRTRWQLGVNGRMPVSDELPYQWYNTPNIHLCTLHDFEAFCAERGVRILERLVLHENKPVRLLPNLRGSLAVYRCSKA
ncbi:MAG: methionine biosynthesis protein MetW [Burkholderiales bacterium]|nr:methionine biosynthesis protein MetW [Burkholderiales bacterium]PZN02086.1 MAG: methionine biosynthesis protein MetW [Pseudomonadota bacterium]